MKKGILVLLIVAVVAGSAFADFNILSFPAPVAPGSVMIDAGLGLRVLSWETLALKLSIPPLFLQGEYALPVGVPISVGGGITIAQWKWNDRWFGNDFGYKVTYITPHLSGNWHWGFDISWLDFFTGISLGYDIASVKWNDSWMEKTYSGSVAKGRFLFAFQAGAHFYFSDHVGVLVQTGYPYWLKAGLALKFGGSGGGSSSSQSARSSSSGTSRTSSRAEYMLVDADSLNIRKGPSADTEAVGSVKRNDRVEILEKPGQWWKIKYGNVEGYVNSNYLKAE